MTALYPGSITGRSARAIADSVESQVRSGGIVAGALLPPVRALADDLEVSPGTVASAYRILRDRGITIADGRRGTAVRPALHESIWSRALALGGGTAPAGDAAATGSAPPLPEGVIDLASGNPDPALLPRLEPALGRLRPDARPVLYGSSICSARLAAAAREQLGADGIPTDHLTMTFGALDGIRRVLASWLRAGDRVAVEDPGWPSSFDVLRSLGLRPIPLGLDAEGPVPASLERALSSGAAAAIVTARAQNPTGSAISPARAEALARVLRSHPATLVVEDDHGYGITPVPLAPLAGATERFAFVRSPAKAYGPDLRLAVLAGDAETVARVEGSLAVGPGWVSHLTQDLLVELWQDSEASAAIARAGAAYDQRRHAVSAALAERRIPTSPSASGLNCWLPVADEGAAVGALLAEGWLVSAGGPFRLAAGPGIRITTAILAPERAPALAAAVSRALRRRPGPAV